MKTAVLTAVLMVLAGCTSMRSSAVAEAAREYGAVTRSMNRGEVYELLGPPQAELPDGRDHWRVADGSRVAELWVRFDPDGGITEVARRSLMD